MISDWALMVPLSTYMLYVPVTYTATGDNTVMSSRLKARGASQQLVLTAIRTSEVVRVLVVLHGVRYRKLPLCRPRVIFVCALFGRPRVILLFALFPWRAGSGRWHLREPR